MPGTTDSASSPADFHPSVLIWTFSAVGLLATLCGAYYLIRHLRYRRAFKEGNRRMAERGENLFSIDGEGTAVHVDDVREEARPRPFLGGVGSEGARTSVPMGMARDDDPAPESPSESRPRPDSHLLEILPPYSSQQHR